MKLQARLPSLASHGLKYRIFFQDFFYHTMRCIQASALHHEDEFIDVDLDPSW